MTKILPFFLLIFFAFSCADKEKKFKPLQQTITESVYASGIIKSKDQYQAFAVVNGIINTVFLSEGDSVKIGTPVLSISSEIQELNEENAELSAQFSDFDANKGKLNASGSLVELSKNKMELDSALYFRQAILWKQQIGTKVDLEQRELAYKNSKNAYYNSLVNYNDLKRQLDYASLQTKKNLLISKKLKNDYTLRSDIDGIVYSLKKKKGEIVNLQTPLAIIGDPKAFILEMQVDEYDILKIKKGLKVLVTLDSYKEKVFDAVVTKIYPLMNEQSKTFLVEAEFLEAPQTLYPNISFEASIIIQSRAKALVIPRSFIMDDSVVIKSNGQKVVVKTGLRDYNKIEIVSGITVNDELKMPVK